MGEMQDDGIALDLGAPIGDSRETERGTISQLAHVDESVGAEWRAGAGRGGRGRVGRGGRVSVDKEEARRMR